MQLYLQEDWIWPGTSKEDQKCSPFLRGAVFTRGHVISGSTTLKQQNKTCYNMRAQIRSQDRAHSLQQFMIKKQWYQNPTSQHYYPACATVVCAQRKLKREKWK